MVICSAAAENKHRLLLDCVENSFARIKTRDGETVRGLQQLCRCGLNAQNHSEAFPAELSSPLLPLNLVL